jgi:hypothetical protein
VKPGYIRAQRALIVFQREDVISLLVHDFRGDFLLTTAHESPRTTKLYDRTDDAIRLDEVERITI